MPESALTYIPSIGQVDEAHFGYIAPQLRALMQACHATTKLITGASTIVRYGETQATDTAHY
jgi:hypothetical protein